MGSAPKASLGNFTNGVSTRLDATTSAHRSIVTQQIQEIVSASPTRARRRNRNGARIEARGRRRARQAHESTHQASGRGRVRSRLAVRFRCRLRRVARERIRIGIRQGGQRPESDDERRGRVGLPLPRRHRRSGPDREQPQPLSGDGDVGDRGRGRSCHRARRATPVDMGSPSRIRPGFRFSYQPTEVRRSFSWTRCPWRRPPRTSAKERPSRFPWP
jgi:hypothetical protein